MSRRRLDPQVIVDDIQRAIQSCDATDWPNILHWADELKAKQSRSIVENLLLCLIELEARKRGKGDQHDNDS